MKLQSVETRILFSLAAFFALCLLLAAISHRSDDVYVKHAVADLARNQSLLLDRALELRGDALANLVNDYSYWDDLIASIGKGDTSWTRKNIDPGLTTYHISAIWVLRLDYSLMYETTIWPGQQVAARLTPTANGRALFGQTAFRHYFVRTELGLFEVRTAPIQPTTDGDRNGPAHGYLCGARLWDSSFVDGLAGVANARLALFTPEEASVRLRSQPELGLLRYGDTLMGYDGKPAAVIGAEAESQLVQRVWRDNKPIWVLVVVSLSLLALAAGLMHIWVSRPILKIATALEQEDTRLSQSLERDKSELGRIARLVTQFFEQKRNLLKEIGDRARAQEALLDLKKTHEALLDEQRLLLENTRDFLYRHDANGVFHYLSPSVETVTGYRPDEWFKHYTETLTDDPVNENVVKYTEQAIREGLPCPPYQVEVYHKNGHRIRLEVSEQPYFEQGKVAGIVGVARDISLRWKAEQEKESLQLQLEKAQRMESLALLAGGVAHDLNNTLGPLVAYPDLILEKLPPDHATVGHVKTVKRAATQAAAIIHDLLMLARRGRYEMEPVNMNEVAADYLDSPTYRDLCERHPRITPVIELADGQLMLQGSSSHLATVLMNLVGNAFDAMPSGGTLTVKTYRETIARATSGRWPVSAGEYVIVSVRDTGVGISPEDIDKIFEPYYSKKKMGRSGTGLGLAVVYGIVKDHKGFYAIDSEPGKGTSFSLLFPATHERATSDERTAIAGGSERLLVVDDNDEQRHMTELLLHSLGYKTESVGSGAAAVSRLEQSSFDLVVLDMIMPEMDGKATYEALLHISPNLRAIIVSGYSPTEQVYAMQGRGAGEFVRKPFTRDQLAKAVRTELDRRAVTSSSLAVR